MLPYLLKRLAVAVLVALTVSLITFSMIYLSGDPAMALAGESATEQDIANIRSYYGYDRPIVVQYSDWLLRAMQGDFGQSHYLKKPVAEVIFERLPTTMLLGFCALVFELTLSIPLASDASAEIVTRPFTAPPSTMTSSDPQVAPEMMPGTPPIL